MIPERIAVNFKSATLKQKRAAAKIFIDNYVDLVNKFVSEADYACTTGYWRGHIPFGSRFMSASEFIKKYGIGKNKKKKQFN